MYWITKQQKLRQPPSEAGSFLLELLIATALISITLVMVVGTYSSLQSSYYHALAKKELTDSVALVLEDITRESRISADFNDSDNDGAVSGSLVLKRSDDINEQIAAEVMYSLAVGILEKEIGGGASIALTPSSVEITKFSVRKFKGDDEPDRIRVNIAAQPKVDRTGVGEMYFQTTLTKRQY